MIRGWVAWSDQPIISQLTVRVYYVIILTAKTNTTVTAQPSRNYIHKSDPLNSQAEKLQRKLLAASVNNTTIAVKNCKRESGQCGEGGGMFALELRVANSLPGSAVSVYHQRPPPSSISLCLDVILSPRLHTSASPNSRSSILVLV